MLPLGLSLDRYSGLDWCSAYDLMVPCETYRFGPLQLGLMCAATEGHGPGTGVDSMHFVCTNTSEDEVISDIRISIRTSHESKYYIVGHTPSEVLVPDSLGPGKSVPTMWLYVWPYWNAEEHQRETFNIRPNTWATYTVSFSGGIASWDETVTMEAPEAGDKPFIDYAAKAEGPHA